MATILIDPGVGEGAAAQSGAARLATLKGKRIGLLDNIKHNAEYLLLELSERLRAEHGCDIRLVKKKTYTKFAAPAVLASLADCDAVVTAIGD